jgi:hypothetical protein
MEALKLDVAATLLAADATLAQSRSLQQPRLAGTPGLVR